MSREYKAQVTSKEHRQVVEWRQQQLVLELGRDEYKVSGAQPRVQVQRWLTCVVEQQYEPHAAPEKEKQHQRPEPLVSQKLWYICKT